MSTDEDGIKFKDLCKNHSFFSFLKITNKYIEIKKTESKWAALFALGITVYLVSLFSIKEIIHIIETVIILVIPSSIGAIGFLFSGLALMATIITHKALNKIDAIGKIKSVVGILFSCYFCAGVIVLSIVFSAIFFMIIHYPAISSMTSWNNVLGYIVIGIIGITVYLYFFSLFYLVSLIGTCLKFFFINLYYNDDFTMENNEKIQ